MGKVLFTLTLLFVASGCNAVCGEGATCSNGNFREDCVDRGEIWGGNNLVVTDCQDFTCVDLGNDALCVYGTGIDPMCPEDGTHHLCDGTTYYYCVFGYRAAQKECPSGCVPGNRGCGTGVGCPPQTTCMRDAPNCSQGETRYVCESGALWTCAPADDPADDKIVLNQDCEYMGLNCHAELGECALP